MKKVLMTLAAVALLTVSTFACDLEGLLVGNTTLARKVRNYEKQGYTIVADQSFYSQYRYFAAPVAPYVDGSGTVVMVKSGTNYSLQTEYVYINFEGDVKTNGQCATTITDITTQTVY